MQYRKKGEVNDETAEQTKEEKPANEKKQRNRKPKKDKENGDAQLNGQHEESKGDGEKPA